VISDNELMLKIIKGDIDQVGVLYERYNRMLFGYFFKLTRNQELCEDLVNDVFLKILHSRNKYRGDGIFKVWMFRIARSIFIDNYNRNKRQMVKESIYKNSVNDEAEEDSHLLLERKENKELVHEALLKLSRKEREVIILSKLDELKYKEVAEILGCSEEAAKVRTFRALKNLKITLLKMQN
jgi:RNA polymerase sigma-70 factor (ECF subfamily)